MNNSLTPRAAPVFNDHAFVVNVITRYHQEGP
jgi:hypothetical protein